MSRAAKATYHPGGYGVSEGLKRARAPFFTRNLITGGLISAFAFSVYFYSIRAVAQDDFADLNQPISEEQRRSVRSIEEESSYNEALLADKLSATPVPAAAAAAGVVEAVSPVQALPAASAAPGRTTILQMVRGSFGGRGVQSKLVWGAPDVDRPGRIGEQVPAEKYVRRLV
ncbi:hypothetical protein JCM11641_003705 [Rhodosporidiobolus odoratus]